ncbi:MAG: hypothetical protein JNL64_11145 [Blastocatellia bacterium]|nr:hypothetical protein [Blastocatellia bacterium]
MIDFESLTNDFEVQYRFYSSEEGGRQGPALQGYRCDWQYADIIEERPDQVWMIWPIFLDSNGRFLPENTEVPNQGIAQMLIVDKGLKESVHKNRIRVGIRGYFVEGLKRIAEASVTRVVDLAQ